MSPVSTILSLLQHPAAVPAVVYWKLVRKPVHERDRSAESESLRECFRYLNLTSRSFAAVIQELQPDLLVPICLFYLILRGLDTIEDDMSLDPAAKTPILLAFHEIIRTPGWTFSDSGPAEKDRDLLVHFDVVIDQFSKIKKPYQDVIVEITRRMGFGMNEYLNNADHNKNGVDTLDDYRKYCHHVAGIVGDGLTQLFVLADAIPATVLDQPVWFETMGQFLQQVNIIRDIREDFDDGRRFWPRAVWSKYVTDFGDLFKPEKRKIAVECSSEMVLIALGNVRNCLMYLSTVQEQSVFNFTAIPQTMAISTILLVFQNPAIFDRNVKIRRTEACQLMCRSTHTYETLCSVFREYSRALRRKNDPADRNFLAISAVCANIERYIDSAFPTQGPASGSRSVPALKSPQLSSPRSTPSFTGKNQTIITTAVLAGVVLLLSTFMMFIGWLAGIPLDFLVDSLKSVGSSLLWNPLTGPISVLLPDREL